MSVENYLNTNKKLDKLQKTVTIIGKHTSVTKTDVSGLKKDVSILKSDVSVLKTDVSVLKNDMSILKIDVSTLKDDVSVLKGNVIDIRALLFVQNKRLDSIDERTALIPKLYDNVDKLMGEIIENKQERTFMSHRLSEHTKRLTALENRR